MSLALFLDAGEVAMSPFIVPVAGCMMVFGIIAANVWSGVRRREIQSTERLAAIAKGTPLPPTEEELALTQPRANGDALRSRAQTRRDNVRRGGIVLVGGGIGLIAFFILLEIIIGQREILSGAAAGLIPLGIGIALLVDANLQSRGLTPTGETERR